MKRPINRVKLCFCFAFIGFWLAMGVAGRVLLPKVNDTLVPVELWILSFTIFPVVVIVVIYAVGNLIYALVDWAKKGWEWLHED